MKFIRLCVRRPVATLMFFVGVLLLGYVSLRNLTVDLLPSISYPKLTVLTEYPGAAPQEVEKMITEPLEAELSSIASLKRINSVSKEGLSIITLQFHWETDMDFALLHAKERVEEAADRLPSDAGKPLILQWDPSSRPILIAVLSGGKVGQLREMARYLIKPRLEGLKGIARVEVRGRGEEEVLVSLDPEKMARYGVGFRDVEEAISSYNQIVLGGTIRKHKIRYVVKVEGKIENPSEINLIPVKKEKEREILIKDIGTAKVEEKPRQGEIRFNGRRAVALMLFKESGANTVEVTQRAKREMKAIEREFPGVRFKIVSEDASLITSSINSIKYSIYIGSLLAFLVLVLFLRNFRDPALVALVIPISVISTFVLMYFARVNVNIMSLGGLALGVGMFVDNSIVVLESMFRHRREKPALEAAVDGASEVAGAITAATFTTVVIFLPVIYVYGIAGRLFRDLALTVSFSLFSSLVVSLTLLPSLFAALSKEREKTERRAAQQKRKGLLPWAHFILSLPFLAVFYALAYALKFLLFALKKTYQITALVLRFLFSPVLEGFSRLYSSFDRSYHRFLELCFEKKSIPFLITLFMLLFIIASFPFIKKEFLPSPSTPRFEIEASTGPDYGFDATDEIAKDVETKLLSLRDVVFVFSQVGAVSRFSPSEKSLAVNHMEILAGAVSRERAMDGARKILASYPQLSFSVIPARNALSRYLRLGAENFRMKVFYRVEDYGREAVREILRRLRRVKGLVDLRTNAFLQKPVLAVKFKEKVLREAGISKRELAELIEAALRGKKVTVLKKFQRSYDVVLSTPLREKKELTALLRLPLRINGRVFPLSDLVEFSQVQSPAEITRESQESYYSITADLKGNLEEISRKVASSLAGMELPPGVRVQIGGAERERRRAFRSLYEALALAVLLVYMVMAAQFENLIHPLIIMLTVPMGLFGAFLLLLLTGQSINVISGIGFMVMAGIVVNDAIVKVDYANQLRRRGVSAREAMLQASRIRLRPILMTTFTTVFGLLPMALIRMRGAELQRPLAIVVIGGLLASTFLTLILIPILYEITTKK